VVETLRSAQAGRPSADDEDINISKSVSVRILILVFCRGLFCWTLSWEHTHISAIMENYPQVGSQIKRVLEFASGWRREERAGREGISIQRSSRQKGAEQLTNKWWEGVVVRNNTGQLGSSVVTLSFGPQKIGEAIEGLKLFEQGRPLSGQGQWPWVHNQEPLSGTRSANAQRGFRSPHGQATWDNDTLISSSSHFCSKSRSPYRTRCQSTYD
jgi:hypothetical protein